MPNFSLKGLMFTITKRVAEDKDSRAGFCRTVYVMGWLTKILKGLSLGDKYSRKHHRRYEDEEIWECPPTTAHLESVIKSKIPSITSLINKGIDEMESELDRLGRPIAVDAGAQLYSQGASRWLLQGCGNIDLILD